MLVRLPYAPVFAEYCYAVHSVEYDALPSYSLVFGVRDDARKLWWDWDRVAAEASKLELPTVSVLFRGTITTERDLEEVTTALASEPSQFGGGREGVVVRVAGQFDDTTFSRSLAKWVRKNHVTSDEHWLHQPIRPQLLQHAASVSRQVSGQSPRDRSQK